MKNNLFNKLNHQSPDWVVNEFFNTLYMRGEFLKSISDLLGRTGYVLNEERCIFPDFTDPDPSCHFKGVMFGIVDEEYVVSDIQFFEYVELAVNQYFIRHPDEADKVEEILSVIRNRRWIQ
ncbi:ribonuclease toxin immunity protein CdiI [Massilia sp. P8910]|uniref:ribonuclease toxin immunity protein CdiI n=1 Tax=Massilia antarctica TaxID=2765360 RepID=UPI001E3F88D6|nr:ribonuclease toxin immunity protein CdiI [Massilia antarctica]MCE3602211.1 ribonuclease toxin immunity protein CdiI [Massilia antarctica]